MFYFFFNDTATTEIYTLSLHDALPICGRPGNGELRSRLPRGRNLPAPGRRAAPRGRHGRLPGPPPLPDRDRKSTRLNSSHANISYAVFCLKKKNISALYSSVIIVSLPS